MGEQRPPRSVVVGVDGSEGALPAVRWAAAEAHRCGLPLRLVNAVLLQLCEQEQLVVVVGSRGRGEFSSLFLGSVSHALLHKAACPVAVVRPSEVARTGNEG